MAHLCALPGLSTSSYYYQAVGRFDEADDLTVIQALIKAAGKQPAAGYRRLTKTLRLQKRFADLNNTRVRRPMTAARLRTKKHKKKVFTTNSQHDYKRYPSLVRDLVIDHPDHVWVCDITFLVLGSGEIVYLAIVMDVFIRRGRGWALGTNLTHSLTKEALRRGVCAIHHTDQGVQYATPKYTQALLQGGVTLSMAAAGKAWENGYAERWMRTLKEEEVYLNEYDTYADALANLGRFIDVVYNKKRMHSAIGDLSSAQFEAQWWAAQ